ncbi:Unknown protein, partial [Striga hermonthica]
EFKNSQQDTRTSWLILLYASTSKQLRAQQWEYLIQAKSKWRQDWAIGGDWNEICCDADKIGGRLRTPSSYSDFNKFISDMGMNEVPFRGHPFTWCNHRSHEDFIEEKIDRVFGSFQWLSSNNNATVTSLIKSASDRTMLILDSNPNQLSKRKRRFIFDKRWLAMEGIEETVKSVWSAPNEGTPMFAVKEKLKATRVALLKWSQALNINKSGTIERLTLQLQEMREHSNNMNWDEWNKITIELDEAYTSEEEFWRQKARNQWLKEGEQNSKFFHALTIQRRKTNAITRLVDDNNILRETDEKIQDCVVDFYSQLFSTDGFRGDAGILNLIPQTISCDLNDSLICPVEEEEIKNALFCMSPNKAPGEDGYPPLLFQHFWPIIKEDLCTAITSFFSSGMILKSWNTTLITLVPKCINPTSLSQFRPISLCGVSYKIISNILASRLMVCLNHCISSSQSAFIPERQLIDNVILAQEAIHFLHRHRSGGKTFMALKLDMIKAFDKLEWHSIINILLKMGFYPSFVKWIHACISTSAFSFNLNGRVAGFISPSRGVRQGDPLSPYLFIVVTEALSRLIAADVHAHSFNGLKISRGG